MKALQGLSKLLSIQSSRGSIVHKWWSFFDPDWLPSDPVILGSATNYPCSKLGMSPERKIWGKKISLGNAI